MAPIPHAAAHWGHLDEAELKLLREKFHGLWMRLAS